MFSDTSPGDPESPTLAYHQLSFDDELFTARVYKRNYRHSLMFFKTRVPEQSQARSPSTESLRAAGLAQQMPLLGETQHQDDTPGIHPRLSTASGEKLEDRQAPYTVESGFDYVETTQVANPVLTTASQVAELDEAGSSKIIEPGKGRNTVDTPQEDEIFKTFRVSMTDPCHKALAAVLKKYNINDDWRKYALCIVYDEEERRIGVEEQPLVLFKKLDREGRKPMFMLRKRATPIEWSDRPGYF